MRIRIFMSIAFSLIGIAIVPQQAAAHFVLDAPESWMAQNQIGDPQKPAPCGVTSTQAGTPSNIVTKVTGGTKLHLKIREIIYHPGHYRVALAVNDHSELPPGAPTATRRWPLPTYGGFDKALRNRHRHSEHQLREVHLAGDRMDGRALLERTGGFFVPPLRRPANNGRSGEANRHPLAQAAVNRTPAAVPPVAKRHRTLDISGSHMTEPGR